jgi:hypothetical protein
MVDLFWCEPQPDASTTSGHKLQREGVLDVLIRRAIYPSSLLLEQLQQEPQHPRRPRPFLAALSPLSSQKKSPPYVPDTCARASDRVFECRGKGGGW